MTRVSEQSEWLSLVDVSGPFLAPAVLEEVFPQGLEKIDTPARQRLRAAYDEWRDAVDGDDSKLAELHAAWTEMVLRETLEYEGDVLVSPDRLGNEVIYRSIESGKKVVPDSVVRGDDGTLRLLVAIHPPEVDLEGPSSGDGWAASLAERMTLLCRANGVRIGLVTNGEQWMLVNAPIGSTSGYVSWFARLWWQEPVTLRAFVSLLGVRRCFGPRESALDHLLERSVAFQEEVTDTLGEQVRRAVEVLIQALGRADQDRNGELLEDVPPAQLYEAGLTVLMRLVFVLCAEERGLFLLGDPIYDQHYALSTLRARLREDESQHGPEVLERRQDAWSRLLSVFRAVYGGVDHEAIRMPALGGSLFDPDRFPFLEGRKKGSSWRNEPAFPLPIDNRTVLLLLSALQILEQRGGARFLSYKGLDVEQIGHVYEGLLEYTVAQVPEVTIGLVGSQKFRHPTIDLATLEELSRRGTKTAADRLAEVTGRSASAIANALERRTNEAAFLGLLQACGGDEALAHRLQPFAGLIRTDSWDSPLVYRAGSFAIMRGADRRETGTHYTPRALAESIVEKTLEPIVYDGPADGRPREEWKLKKPAELLDVKICDPAMGSGAFLVQTCRYLGERLVSAWTREERAGRAVTADGVVCDALDNQEPMPKDTDDRLLIANRLIAERCLYGVDLNPLAVELAKLSIWLVTLAKGRPFGFLDHNLRCGDSLLGIHHLDQLTELRIQPALKQKQARLFGRSIAAAVDEAIELRKRLREIPIRDIRDVEVMARLDSQSRQAIEKSLLLSDVLVGEALRSNGGREALETRQDALSTQAEHFLNGDERIAAGLRDSARQALSLERLEGKPARRPFHWPLEFPEVFAREKAGFDAIVGNPPFMGGRLIGRSFGMRYQEYLRFVRNDVRGSPDLCAYFVLRAFALTNAEGCIGLLSTKSIAETGSRVVALEQILTRGGCIYSAYSRMPWPGRAAVVVAILWITKRPWSGQACLDGRLVRKINGGLEEAMLDAMPARLQELHGQYSQGQDIMGRGFELNEDEKEELLAKDPKSSEVIFALFNGQDLNSMAELNPYRWVIYFRDWPEEKARQYSAAFERVQRLVKPYREGLRGQIHQQCFWKFWDLRPRLMKELENHTSVLASAIVTKYVSFRRVPTSNIYNTKTKLYFFHDWRYFAIVQSTFHQQWATWLCGTLGATTLNYSTSAALATWPMPAMDNPEAMQRLDSIARDYHEFRERLMKTLGEGPTLVYNRFHDANETAPSIRELRNLHVAMDRAVAVAYGWKDLVLEYDFNETAQGMRFTYSDTAQLEILSRLSKLNNERSLGVRSMKKGKLQPMESK